MLPADYSMHKLPETSVSALADSPGLQRLLCTCHHGSSPFFSFFMLTMVCAVVSEVK
jgi:hypothetical protein